MHEAVFSVRGVDSSMRRRAQGGLVLLCLGWLACSEGKINRKIDPLMSPAGMGSAEGHLVVGADGRLYLSWIEAESAGHVFRFSSWTGDGWSKPQMIARGSDWFVNWADVPAMTALADGSSLMAHWLSKIGKGTYAYGLQVTRSLDAGRSWTLPIAPHRDTTETEHGFASWAALPDDRAALVWLDGRETSGEEGHGGAMTLRFATLTSDGTLGDETLLDSRVCDCCSTDLVALGDGSLLAVYRDRSEEEIRDIRLARYDGRTWSEGELVHRDGWKIAGCPVNGPAIDAKGNLVAVAWFTVDRADRGHVRLAFSKDGGHVFDDLIEIGGENPLGRVDLALLPDGTAWVVWMQAAKDGEGQVLVRSADSRGRLSEPTIVATTSGSRSSGVPRLANLENDLFVVWTSAPQKEDRPTRVLTARIH